MMRYTAGEIIWSGVPVLRLYDGETDTEALLSAGIGANLFSLRVGERQLLRCPPDAETLRSHATGYGTPVLMPPSRIAGGHFRFNGREYQLERNTPDGLNHIHGFVVRRPWEVAECTAGGEGARTTLRFCADRHPDVLAQFPHPFRLSITYTLTGTALTCEATIANDGDEPMPFGLGFHPYLATPEPAPGRYRLRLVPDSRPWEMVDKIPSGRLLHPEGALDIAHWQDAHALWRDHGYALVDDEPGSSRCDLEDLATGHRLTVTASEEYRHWVVYNGRPGNDGFVCLEPYTCSTNAFNLPPAFSGAVAIAPGERRSAGSWGLTWL